MSPDAAPCVVFFHAHPDDESIFTGGTIALLADRGVRTVVVIATGVEPVSPADDPTTVAAVRGAEAAAACALLGVDALHLLGFADAGAVDAVAGDGTAALHTAPLDDVARRLAELLVSERATALVVYDEGGIYAHPDHLVVHRAGVAAAEMAGVDVVYEATVDREYLHFVETHLVGHAVEWLVGADALVALNRAPLGVPTVMVSTTVDVGPVLARKRAAIETHVSQIPRGGAFRSMDDETFAAVYGYEWFVRRGPVGPLDTVAS
ncbi:MAG: PIG-L family deacetylase [Actinobacteria bacterium]|nr:PIG-L family deacetylase [Actinomycetota bacterium]